MKQYHTIIHIHKPIDVVWMHLTDFSKYSTWNPLVSKIKGEMLEGEKINVFIVPLGKSYDVKLLHYQVNKEISWLGVKGARFLMSGKHYYELVKVNENETKLLHGEFFTGIFSFFIPKRLLLKMENSFNEHNIRFKRLVENEK